MLCSWGNDSSYMARGSRAWPLFLSFQSSVFAFCLSNPPHPQCGLVISKTRLHSKHKHSIWVCCDPLFLLSSIPLNIIWASFEDRKHSRLFSANKKQRWVEASIFTAAARPQLVLNINDSPLNWLGSILYALHVKQGSWSKFDIIFSPTDMLRLWICWLYKNKIV